MLLHLCLIRNRFQAKDSLIHVPYATFPTAVIARKKIIARINGKRNSKSIISATTNAIFYFFGVETIVIISAYDRIILAQIISLTIFIDRIEANSFVKIVIIDSDFYHVWKCNARKSDRIYPIYREFILLLATSIDSHQTSNALFQDHKIIVISQFTSTFLSFVVRGIRESKRQYDVL